VTDTTERAAHAQAPTDQLARYELTDRFRLEDGRVFLSGVQAMARLPGDQLRIDRRAGLTTAAFVSGYQGSPLASFDGELVRAARTLPDLPIVIQPGLNEELAATSVMGSQLTDSLHDHVYDGVMGMWFGKAPGLDRAGDAIRHGVFAGTARHGGVVAVVGDDPNAKSSTLPSSSDATFVDLHMPILFPGDVQETLDLGRHAVALSRASGIWAGVKLVTPVCDGTGTVDVAIDRVEPVIPMIEWEGKPFVPHPSGRLLTPYTLDMEREFLEVRSVVARQYGVENKLNQITVRGPSDWIGMMASGHTYHELREALELLGFETDQQLRDAGIRLYQLLMPVPLDDQQIREFAHELAEVLVVEEKNPTLEWLVKNALYDGVARPRVVGKHDEHGEWLVPGTSMLDADRLLEPLHRRLSQRLGDDRLRPLPQRVERSLIPLAVQRTPFYCSGCPHNLSTRVEEGTLVGGGIGCHAMVALMEPDRIGDIAGLTAMGNEGAQWIGMAPFLERKHLVQNLGDGTFFHSGHLAIRAAIAAGIDITYKLLYNGTVAMTGGQDAVGAMTVPEVTTSLLLEGAQRIIITSDEPGKYDRRDFDARFAERLEIWDRTRLPEAQAVLAEVKGVTVLIHDQACAAELRRARSRGKIATPGFRVVINERVCEGCGDCGDVSNCLSVQPIDTPYGRKTMIHQTSCNFDMSCMRGDCPAFATVTVDPDAEPERAYRGDPTTIGVDDLPAPAALVPTDNFSVRMSGIGGTGVITVSQVLGTAAMLDGLVVRGLDQTGLSQKAGPVVSDLRIARDKVAAANHASVSGVDCMLGFDLLVAASDTHRAGADPDRTVVVGSLAAVPTGSMVTHPDTAFPTAAALTGRLDEVSRAEHNAYVDSAAITEGLFGSGTTANVFLLGVAVQQGAIAVSPESIERGIELNGVAVARNVAAFRWGRHWVTDPRGTEAAAGITAPPAPETLDALIERLSDDLTEYQSAKYAKRFRDRVAAVRAKEREVLHDSTELTDAVARNLHKLMAYKDEYEVARLLTLPEMTEKYRQVGGKDTEVTWRLHPPTLRAMGMGKKIEMGAKTRPMFAALKRGKRLRGTRADPFRFGEVRRLEREMIPEFDAALDTVIAGLSSENHAEAVAIASLPDQVRGYEHLKVRRAKAYRAELADRLAVFQGE
jgi:indolepyruvate ferredoxin oxidoreductase